MELTLVDYDMVHYHPSKVAAAASCLSQKVLGQGKWVSIEFKKKCISYILGPLDMKCISIFTVLSLKQLLKFHKLKRAAGMMQVETGGLCHGILHMLCYSIVKSEEGH